MSSLAPTTAKRTVGLGRKRNSEVRAREDLTEAEVEQLCQAARKRGRYGQRDAAMILLCYRHGLRVSELVALQWQQVDLNAGRLHVTRLKGSDDSVHPLSGTELRVLRSIKRDQPAGSRYLFLSERGAPISTAGFARMLTRTAEAAGWRSCRCTRTCSATLPASS